MRKESERAITRENTLPVIMLTPAQQLNRGAHKHPQNHTFTRGVADRFWRDNSLESIKRQEILDCRAGAKLKARSAALDAAKKKRRCERVESLERRMFLEEQRIKQLEAATRGEVHIVEKRPSGRLAALSSSLSKTMSAAGAARKQVAKHAIAKRAVAQQAIALENALAAVALRKEACVEACAVYAEDFTRSCLGSALDVATVRLADLVAHRHLIGKWKLRSAAKMIQIWYIKLYLKHCDEAKRTLWRICSWGFSEIQRVTARARSKQAKAGLVMQSSFRRRLAVRQATMKRGQRDELNRRIVALRVQRAGRVLNERIKEWHGVRKKKLSVVRMQSCRRTLKDRFLYLQKQGSCVAIQTQARRFLVFKIYGGDDNRALIKLKRQISRECRRVEASIVIASCLQRRFRGARCRRRVKVLEEFWKPPRRRLCSLTVPEVLEHVLEQVHLSEAYAAGFEKQGIDGRLLNDATEDDLLELGVAVRLHRKRILRLCLDIKESGILITCMLPVILTASSIASAASPSSRKKSKLRRNRSSSSSISTQASQPGRRVASMISRHNEPRRLTGSLAPVASGRRSTTTTVQSPPHRRRASMASPSRVKRRISRADSSVDNSERDHHFSAKDITNDHDDDQSSNSHAHLAVTECPAPAQPPPSATNNMLILQDPPDTAPPEFDEDFDDCGNEDIADLFSHRDAGSSSTLGAPL